jgi:hypothetical protein
MKRKKSIKNGIMVFKGGTAIQPPGLVNAIRDNIVHRVVPDKSYEKNFRTYSIMMCQYRSFLVRSGVKPEDVPEDDVAVVAMVRTLSNHKFR